VADASSGDYISTASGGLSGSQKYFSYFVEVPPGLSRLVIDLFDADNGIGGAPDRTGNRDWDYAGTSGFTGSTQYRLYNPSGTQQTTNFAQGTSSAPAGSDNAWLTFFDSNSVVPSLRATTSATGGEVESLDLNVPTGTAANDLLIAVIARDLDDISNTVPTPAGWTLLDQGDCATAVCTMAVFYRVVTTVPASPQTFSWAGNGTQRVSGAMFAFSGIDTTTPFDVAVASNTGTGANPLAPSVTTTTSGTLLLRLAAAGPNVAFTQPAGYTEAWDAGSGTGMTANSQRVCGSGAWATQAIPGSTGTATFTAGVTRWRTTTVALRRAFSLTAGHWEVRVDLSAAGGDEISAFGLRAHDGDSSAGGTELNVYYQPYTQYGTDDANQSAIDQRAFVNYPWVTSGCSCYMHNWDGDGAGTFAFDRPDRSQSPAGWAQVGNTINASGATVWGHNTVTGWADSSNATSYGIWRLRHNSVEWSAGNGNIYTFYMTDYTNPTSPPAQWQQDNSIRVYLPTDAGTAPAKPYLEQQVRYRSGSQTVANATETIVTVTVKLVNPTPWAITFGSPATNAVTTNIPGGQATCYQTNCGGQVSQGTFTTPAAGGSGTITWNPGTVPAGTTAILAYNVRLYPVSGGAEPIPVTAAASLPNGTKATYVDETGSTQARARMTLGPLCQLQVSRGLLTQAVASALTTYRHREGVLVRWETASEAGTAAYRLERREPGSKTFVAVSEEPVAALPEAPQGAAYELVDRAADSRSTQVYRLIEIERSGNERELGVFETEPQDDPERWDAEAVSRAPWPQQPEPALPDGPTSDAAHGHPAGAKIAVPTDGLYDVSAASLAPVLGLTPAAVQAKILAGMVALSNRGASVAWLPSASGDRLFFYGQGLDSPFSVNNIYVLTLAQGLRMQAGGSAPPDGPGLLSSPTTRHTEVDLYPVINGPLNAEGDFWFWDYLLAGDAKNGRKPFTLDIPAVASGSLQATLAVALQGVSATGITKEHHARVFVNGTMVGEGWWEGITAHTVTSTFQQSLLRDGHNTIEVEAVKDPGVPYSYIYLDSIDVSYERRHEAESSALLVTSRAAKGVTVNGFADSTVKVLDITDHFRPRLFGLVRVEPKDGAFQVTFAAPTTSRAFFLASGAGVKQPARIWRDNQSSLRTRQNSADYVVITAPELVGAAEGLADLRRDTGLRSQVVDLEDIYDEFNSSLPSPRAIQSFLAYARASWAPGPSMVVLAGAGTYDYKNLLGFGGNLVPPLLVSTPAGLFSSDTTLADVIGHDGVPDLAIGRLPVTSPGELTAQVDKIRAFEQSKAGEWAGHALLVADNPEGGVDFGADSDALAPFLPGTLTAEPVHLGPLPLAKARATLLSEWRSGAALVSYFGHGGHDRWATEGLLVTTDIADLSNEERLPLVASMTCVIGRFEIPGIDSLGEALVRRDGGGAIAVWAPSGVGNHPDSKVLAQYFAAALMATGTPDEVRSVPPGGNRQPRIGSAVTAALARLASNGGDMRTGVLYNLLGDPAVRLRSVLPASPPPLVGPGEP